MKQKEKKNSTKSLGLDNIFKTTHTDTHTHTQSTYIIQIYLQIGMFLIA